MGKSNDTTTQRVTSDPWTGVQTPLKEGIADLGQAYNAGPPSYYSGSTVAPLSGYTEGALDWQAQRAQAGSPITQAGQQELTRTLSGNYLDAGNPYFSQATQAAIRPITEQYEDVVMPGLDSTFSAAGRYGSGAHQDAAAKGYEGMLRAVGDTTANMAYQNYGDERQNQMRGMLFAPQMANQDYYDINALGAAGSAMDAYNQQLINADIDRWNYQQNTPFNWASQYMANLSGVPGGSQVNTTQQPAPNIFTSAAGGALAGGSIGGIPGALVGGGLGLLSGLF